MNAFLKTIIALLIFCIGSTLSPNTFFDVEINDPQEMILGKWESEGSPDFIWHFYENSSLYFLDDGQLFEEAEWHIVHQCEGETADNEEDFAMLEVLYAENDKQCYVVQGLNGVLTLLSLPQGRLLIFDRAED
ncbi:MAG: hypothetical protein JJU46_09730 [Balneolaceae bacterium]|nr:hypothetical protein [Balneolaceae bacterium]